MFDELRSKPMSKKMRHRIKRFWGGSRRRTCMSGGSGGSGNSGVSGGSNRTGSNISAGYDKYARLKNAGVGYLVGSALGGRNGGLLGAAVGGVGNVGFFRGGSKLRADRVAGGRSSRVAGGRRVAGGTRMSGGVRCEQNPSDPNCTVKSSDMNFSERVLNTIGFSKSAHSRARARLYSR